MRNATTARAIQITENITKEKLKECQIQSDETSKDSDCTELEKLVEVVQKRDKFLGELPIGWSNTALSDFSTLSWRVGLENLVRWLLTALAVSLGAPFWFDLLSKAVSIRHGMKKPE